MTQQPNWRPVVLRGVSAAIECQRDQNARPGAPAWNALRWRRRAHTGEALDHWRPGAPPSARPETPRETWAQVARIGLVRGLFVLIIVLWLLA